MDAGDIWASNIFKRRPVNKARMYRHEIMGDGIVLNPHYKTMGLYGSEYWTYLLPRRVGQEKAIELTENGLPISTQQAHDMLLYVID